MSFWRGKGKMRIVRLSERWRKRKRDIRKAKEGEEDFTQLAQFV